MYLRYHCVAVVVGMAVELEAYPVVFTTPLSFIHDCLLGVLIYALHQELHDGYHVCCRMHRERSFSGSKSFAWLDNRTIANLHTLFNFKCIKEVKPQYCISYIWVYG